ncbi:MAG TPA: hypothetical protein VHB77_21800 [Planctomycetaceae bacterium]|nr:hypothetical protein [Planctomycetaceae bacterium]
MGESHSTNAIPSWIPWLLTTIFGGVWMAQSFKEPAHPPAAAPVHAGAQDVPKTGCKRSDRQARVESPLYDFFGIPTPEPEADDSRGTELRQRLAHCRLEFMLVTIPDPVDSAEGYYFDMTVDALQKALTVDRKDPWLYVGCYLPWQIYRDRLDRSPDVSLDRSQRWYEDEPGLLLYHRSRSDSAGPGPDADDLLAIFLVGELPSSGIRRTAFDSAIKEIRRLRLLQSSPAPADRLPIIGPFFTGSAPSLANSICGQKDAHPDEFQYFVLTGSATGVDPDLFPRHHIPFAATVTHWNRVRDAIIRHVAESRGLSQPKLAWLIETGTGFGGSFNPRREERNGNERDAEKSDGDQTAKTDVDHYVFPYPAQISRVRATFETRLSSSRASLPALLPLQSTDPLPFDALDTTRDLPTMQTPRMTAPSVELELAQIVDSLRRSKCDHVAIMSTDVRDAIFLAQFVKLHCPTVQLIIPETDILHVHPEYQDALCGALAFSSYPLFAEGLHWSALEMQGTNHLAAPSSTVLPNQAMFGIYNAVQLHRALIQRSQSDSADKSADILSDWRFDISDPACTRARFIAGCATPFEFREDEAGKEIVNPGIWVHVIGASRFYPLKFIPGPPMPEKPGPYAITMRVNTPRTMPAPLVFNERTALAVVFEFLLLSLVILTLFVRTQRWPFNLIFPARRNAIVRRLRPWIGGLMLLAALYPAVLIGLNFRDRLRSGSQLDAFLSAWTDENPFSGVSLLFVGLLVTVAMLAMSFGWWRRAFLLDAQCEQFSGPSPINAEVSAFPLWEGFRSLNSKLMLLVSGIGLAVGYLLLFHACRVQVMRFSPTFLVVWCGLIVTILVWWLALLNLCASYALLKTFLHDCRQSANKPDDWQHWRDLGKRICAAAPRGLGHLWLGPGPSPHDAFSRELGADSVERQQFYLPVQIRFSQLRNHIFSQAVAAVALILAVNSFPFSSAPWLRFVTTAGLLVLASLICWFYVRLERDEFLSTMLGTDPGVVTWNWQMVQYLAGFVALALFTLILQTVPESADWFGELLQPVARLGR